MRAHGAWAIMFVAAACGAGSSAGTADGGTCAPAPELVSPAPACNTLANAAPAVPFTAGVGAPPTPAGGAVAEGVYHATRVEGFGSAAPSGRRLSIAVLEGGARFLWAGDVLDAAAMTTSFSFRADTHVAADGAQLSFTVDCSSSTPSPIPPALGYTATGDQLILVLANGGATSVTTYTRAGCE